jgi:hypothetical protein
MALSNGHLAAAEPGLPAAGGGRAGRRPGGQAAGRAGGRAGRRPGGRRPGGGLAANAVRAPAPGEAAEEALLGEIAGVPAEEAS